MGTIAALLGASLAVAPAASALLPTTTTVTASPATSVEGTAVTLTASVYLKPVGGLIITPSGKVFFSAVQGTQSTPLGSATLSRCLLTTCHASITTTAIPAGSTLAKASYVGDLVANASVGTTPITVVDPSTSTVTCPSNTTCSTETVVSDDGLTELQVTADGSSSSQTVTATLDQGPVLHCVGDTDPHLGALGTFSTTATDAGLTINYQGNGAVGAQMWQNYYNHSDHVGCWGEPGPFQGFVNGVFTNAVFVPADGLYEAQLASCYFYPGTTPCFLNTLNFDGSDIYRVYTTVGDPKIIG